MVKQQLSLMGVTVNRLSKLDWEMCLTQHSESVCFLAKQSDLSKTLEHTTVLDHKGVYNSTAKAKFYLTDNGLAKTGFWLPKSVIVEETKTTVTLKPNCNIEIKEITYV